MIYYYGKTLSCPLSLAFSGTPDSRQIQLTGPAPAAAGSCALGSALLHWHCRRHAVDSRSSKMFQKLLKKKARILKIGPLEKARPEEKAQLQSASPPSRLLAPPPFCEFLFCSATRGFVPLHTETGKINAWDRCCSRRLGLRPLAGSRSIDNSVRMTKLKEQGVDSAMSMSEGCQRYELHV